jgi:hypothetical protein
VTVGEWEQKEKPMEKASLEFCVSPAKIMSFYIIINIFHQSKEK